MRRNFRKPKNCAVLIFLPNNRDVYEKRFDTSNLRRVSANVSCAWSEVSPNQCEFMLLQRKH